MQSQFEDIGSPYCSKKRLYYSWVKFLKVLQNLATQRSLMFHDLSGRQEVIDHYENLLRQLLPLGKSLKAAATKEKLDKDELSAETERSNNER